MALLVFVFVAVVWFQCLDQDSRDQQDRPRSPATDPAAAEKVAAQKQAELAKQPERMRFIAKLKAMEVISKTRSRSSGIVEVWIGPAFHVLDFDQKETFISVIYAYENLNDPRCTFLRIIDGMNGKEIGQFGPSEGGLKLY